MKRMFGLAMLAIGAVLSLGAVPTWANSQARIVRLSNVEGDVQIDRGTENGYEKAFLNLPLTQGAVLATKADAKAEVEFEDGSTLRLTPNTTVEFSDLSLLDSGARVSTIALKAGQVYVNYTAKRRSDQFTLVFAQEKVTVAEAVHFRVNVDDSSAEIAVFKGDLKVDSPGGLAELSKNKTATFNRADGDKFVVAKNLEEDPYDTWDKQQVKYHDEYAKNGSYNDYPYGYGVSDLNYYGSYANVPGYGMMWQPYFASASWSPFADGAWVFYPGFGYTFVSGYPWGWMPYRYGSWVQVPGYGWMWQPGAWAGGGWYSVPQVRNPPTRNVVPQAPGWGTGTVVVGKGFAGNGIPSRRVTVQPGSAGFGIPRGAGDLHKVSREVQQNGFATIRTAPPTRQGWSSAPSSSAPSYGGGGAGHATSAGSSGHATSSSHASSGGHSAPPARH